jgi:hypothetical protein
MIEHAVRTILKSDDGVSAIAGDRIYYLVAPEKTPAPYIVISGVAKAADHTHDGPSGLREARIQVSAFADSYLDVSDLTQAVKDCLDGFTGQSEGVTIEKCLYINEVDMYEPNTGLQFKPSDYEIYYKEE